MKALATLLVLVLTALGTAGCDTTGCDVPSGDPGVEIGYASISDWEPVAVGDALQVEPGSQGSGLMVQLNLRLTGVEGAYGAYSDLDVQLVRDGEPLTVEGGHTLAAVCQDDGSLVSRNRRVEFRDTYYTLEDLDGIYEGFDCELQVTVELVDGTLLETQVPVFLEAG